MDEQRIIEVATRAARAAGEIITKAATRRAEIAIEFKGTNDLVTEIDRAAQDAIVGIITREFPGHEVVAEEAGGNVPGNAGHGYRWIVDPLDGTTNFTRGVPPWAVSIGLEYRGEIVMGAVLNVPYDEFFCGWKGGGVTLDGKRIGVSSAESLDETLLTTGFPYREMDQVEAYLSALRRLMKNARGIRRPGAAAVDLAYVACGRFDGFFEVGLMPWDVAAGTLLVREAGGAVTSLRGGDNPVYSGEIIATNGRIHESLLQLVEGMSRTGDGVPSSG